MNILIFNSLVPLIIMLTTLSSFSNLEKKEKKMEINIESRSFKEGEYIPSLYTCEGKNISPQLSWSCSVESVKTFAIIVEDPDAPSGNFTHWIVYNIPARTNSMMENSTPAKKPFIPSPLKS